MNKYLREKVAYRAVMVGCQQCGETHAPLRRLKMELTDEPRLLCPACIVKAAAEEEFIDG